VKKDEVKRRRDDDPRPTRKDQTDLVGVLCAKFHVSLVNVAITDTTHGFNLFQVSFCLET
jgi:hypothetical protein